MTKVKVIKGFQIESNNYQEIYLKISPNGEGTLPRVKFMAKWQRKNYLDRPKRKKKNQEIYLKIFELVSRTLCPKFYFI